VKSRIVAQQGTFTVTGKESFHLDECPAVEQHDGVLEKIVIKSTHVALMSELRVLGVRRATVYPDLPGLAHDITLEEVF